VDESGIPALHSKRVGTEPCVIAGLRSQTASNAYRLAGDPRATDLRLRNLSMTAADGFTNVCGPSFSPERKRNGCAGMSDQ
jgi:hypothetical protein